MYDHKYESEPKRSQLVRGAKDPGVEPEKSDRMKKEINYSAPRFESNIKNPNKREIAPVLNVNKTNIEQIKHTLRQQLQKKMLKFSKDA
jgi:hypothetical protein